MVPGVGIQTVGVQKVVRIKIESLVSIVTKINRYMRLGGYKGRVLLHNCLIVALAKDCQSHELLLEGHKSNSPQKNHKDICPATICSTLH